MFETAYSECVLKLFGPLYFASNDGCHCEMTFDCPETHQRAVCECGNIVSTGSSASGAAVSDEVEDCAKTRGAIAPSSKRNAVARASAAVPSPRVERLGMGPFTLKMNFNFKIISTN